MVFISRPPQPVDVSKNAILALMRLCQDEGNTQAGKFKIQKKLLPFCLAFDRGSEIRPYMGNSSPAAEALFASLQATFAKKSQVKAGKMMSSPGITYKSKVFAFFYKDKMVFKLGKEFEPKDHKISKYSYLSPFKNKAPMKAWFEIPFSEKKHWPTLTELALEYIKKEIKK